MRVRSKAGGRRPLLSVCGLAVVFAMTAGDAAAQNGVAGRWQGAIEVLGTSLQMIVRFDLAGSELNATIDIPPQGAYGIDLTAVSFEAPKVHFELPAGPGLAVFDGALDGDRIEGSFVQAGVTGTFWLTRAPEEPKAAAAAAAPLPYGEEEVQFQNGEITLAGTLTLPEGDGPHPAVVMITGSGPQNRDEELFGFKPFRIIADHLTRHGIAVLRYDDRGVGGSSGNVRSATSDDFAEDALAGVRFLAGRSAVRSDAIGLVGHSEGAIVASMAAARSDRVAFIVLLAGTAVTGEQILYAQGELIARAQGESEERIQAQRDLQHRIFTALRTDTGWDEVEQEIATQTRAAIAEMPAERRQAIADVDSFVANTARQQLAAVRTPWFKFFIDYDPATALRKVRIPVLALFGEKDLQVPPSVNEAPMAAALQAAGNSDYTIEILPKANHLFLPTETGSPSEYPTMPKEFVPELLPRITDWITSRFGS